MHHHHTHSGASQSVRLSPTLGRSAVRSVLLVSLVMAGGCDKKFDFAGSSLVDRFPLDGEREWTYANESSDIAETLTARMTGSRTADKVEVVTIQYSLTGAAAEDGTLPEAEPQFEIEWSADSVGGIQIWSYADIVNETTVVFDEPLIFAEAEMSGNDSVTSSSNGITITSTYLGALELGNAWTTDTWNSAHIVIDDGDGDDTTGPPFAGHWWIAATYGVNQFAPTGYFANEDAYDPNDGTPSGENWYLTNAVFSGGE